MPTTIYLEGFESLIRINSNPLTHCINAWSGKTQQMKMQLEVCMRRKSGRQVISTVNAGRSLGDACVLSVSAEMMKTGTIYRT